MSYSMRWLNAEQQWQCHICEEWVDRAHHNIKQENGVSLVLCNACITVLTTSPSLSIELNEDEARIVALIVQEIDIVHDNILIMNNKGELAPPSIDCLIDLKNKMRKMVIDLLPEVAV